MIMHFPNKTASYYYKISYIAFFLGFPNFYIDDLNVSESFYKAYCIVSKCINIIIPPFIIFELGAFVTQTNLSKKQESDMLIYGISHPILWTYSLIMWRHENDIKELFSHVICAKNIYNDEKIEAKMLNKSTRDSAAVAISCFLTMVLHTLSAFVLLMKSGIFTTVVTAWPLVDDPSCAAHVARIISNMLWWVLMSRVVASYIVTITLTTSINCLFLNLQSYFNNLENIFENNDLEQREKEIKYEKSFTLGIKLHLNTIDYYILVHIGIHNWIEHHCPLTLIAVFSSILQRFKILLGKCLNQFKNISKNIFNAQVIFVVLMLIFLMTQMMKSERTIVNAAATVITATAVLMSTGFFIWNAGDITVEASNLATAMYSSGWHNCHGKSSYRVRKLILFAMTYAQQPVVIQGLGIIDLSYQSYVSLVKSSYSVFSVIY